MRKTVAIMFHTVGLERHEWRNPNISESPRLFAKKMEALYKHGYRTGFFKDHDPTEVHDRKEVVLTFDDGYLDNWVHVFPILQKYGLKATIFVSLDFVDQREVIRPQADPNQIDGAHHDAEKCCAGFLSWPEMREMEKSGLVDIQSHALTHTWYFKGPRIVDFWDPGAAVRRMGPVWMLWNEFPSFKPYYLTQAAEYETRIPYGSPIYEHDKSLGTRRYFPDDGLDQVLPQYVADQGGVKFFDRGDWRTALHAVADRHRGRIGTETAAGRLESEDKYLARVRHELSESKRILERNLEKKIDALCWPGGSMTDQSLEMARGIGYKRFTLPSAWPVARAAGRHAHLCPRMGAGNQMRWKGRSLGRGTTHEFLWSIERISGSKLHRWLGRGSVLARLGRSYLTGS